MQDAPEAVETLLAQFGLHRDFFARALEIGATSVQELQVVANAHEGGVPEDVALHAALQLLPRSTPVRVEGLVGSQELNGCSGRILGPHTNERVPVRLDVGDGSTESVRVRPRNLQLALNLLMLPTELLTVPNWPGRACIGSSRSHEQTCAATRRRRVLESSCRRGGSPACESGRDASRVQGDAARGAELVPWPLDV